VGRVVPCLGPVRQGHGRCHGQQQENTINDRFHSLPPATAAPLSTAEAGTRTSTDEAPDVSTYACAVLVVPAVADVGYGTVKEKLPSAPATVEA